MKLQTTVILAMTIDGKIADREGRAARFASNTDKSHLERLIASMDGVLFGASTLRAYGTSLPITNRQLLEKRLGLNLPPQPVHIVCSASGDIDPKARFFRQPLPRWLLTTPKGEALCRNHPFDKILVNPTPKEEIDWDWAFPQLTKLGLKKLGVLGGGKLVASLVARDLIDELYLTICPLILGGEKAPTPVEGWGLSVAEALKLELVGINAVDSEVFLHYRRSL